MAKYAGIIKLDENEVDKNNLRLISTKTAPLNQERRRAALGELGNKGVPVVENSKENAIKPLKIGAPIGFKHVKARVDSHRIKPVLKEGTTNPTIKTNYIKQTITVKETVDKIKVVEKKPLQRVNSLYIEKKSSLPKCEEAVSTLSLVRKDSKQIKEKPKETIKKVSEINYNIESHSSKLLNQIENIDINDDLNPFLVSEYVDDIYKHLYFLEKSFYVKENHLGNCTEITSNMRSVLIDWINDIHHQFSMVSETFYMTVAIIDRYLQVKHNTKRKELQLVGVAALFTACKYEEMYPTDISDFVYITDYTYNKRQILEMEKQIVRTLDFQVGRPHPITFLRRYSKAASSDGHVHTMAKYFMELTSVDYKMSHIRPSEIAASSLLLALMITSNCYNWNTNIWTSTLQHYSTYSLNDLKGAVKSIAGLVKKAPNGKLKAIYKKYCSNSFNRVAMRNELQGSLIEKICQY